MESKDEEYNWHKVADNIEQINFSCNGMAEVVVNENRFCLIQSENSLSACFQKCPHAGGIMSKGYIDASGNIVCPLHGYKFSLQNGRNVTGEGYLLKTFPVQIRTGAVFIGIGKNKLLNLVK